ncbi:MAG: hypothetical protein BWY63_02353 [Chloroflexi bacterium ADurb.Bin360]|nr:MAG: hypothetical protein BWY63_02353 [Chloroflexi bacterium ADurb.Bin360]
MIVAKTIGDKVDHRAEQFSLVVDRCNITRHLCRKLQLLSALAKITGANIDPLLKRRPRFQQFSIANAQRSFNTATASSTYRLRHDGSE